MKVSDFIVEFLISKKITDVFGYPGGMVTHLMDSFDKYSEDIFAHLNYHEQAAAFAACGYAQVSRKPGIAFATSGPGATNLITGIANAYFDSIPTIFITGQVNTSESKGDFKVRQRGFQETDIVSMVKGITKYSAIVNDANDILYHLEKAHYIALHGRPGSVLLDIPMDIQKSEIKPEALLSYTPEHESKINYNLISKNILNELKLAKKPCIIIGAGVQQNNASIEFIKFAEELKIPIVSSMIAIDIMANSKYYYGFLGAYGHRSANFIVAKSDCILSIGTRLDIRQTGGKIENFAPNSKLLRVDIDTNEFTRKIKENEIQYTANIKPLLQEINRILPLCNFLNFDGWLFICNELKSKLDNIDNQPINKYIKKISKFISPDSIVTTDVGQNQVWVAQSFKVNGQRILFSGGHGSMGYSLPAAIGAYYASGNSVISFNGDGGLQINIQELQFIARENIPIKIIVINNKSLGMIRHFQEMYFNSNYVHTKAQKGYIPPDFTLIGEAYGIPSIKIEQGDSFPIEMLISKSPALIEIIINEDTYVFPKLEYGNLNQDQEPLIDRDLFSYLQKL